MGVETGKSHESPERASMLAACELRRVDEAIYRLRRELAAAATQ